MDERPVTRADLVELLSALKGEFKADLAELRAEFKADLAEQKREILESTQEQVRDAQTEILKAFLPFREEVGIRFRALEVKN